MPEHTPFLTHTGVLRRLLFEAFEALGMEPQAIYRQVYPARQLGLPNSAQRRLHDQAPLFWQALAGLTGDPDIGLHLGEVMRPRPLEVVGYLQHASRDLHEALQMLVRYQHLMSEGFAMQLQVDGDTARLRLDLDYRGHGSLRQQIECLALLFCRQLQQFCDGAFRLSAVSFRHTAPRRLAEHRRLFGLTPGFAAAHDELCFPAALLARPSRNAAPELLDVLQQHAEAQLLALRSDGLRNRARYWLDCQLGQGPCSLASCAAALGLERAQLQRELASQGGFRGLLDEVRRQRALSLLQDGAAIREVARACGFAELSPFYRAFRRWSTLTPQQSRLRLSADRLPG